MEDDTAYLTRLLERYADMVFRLAFVCLKNRADAEDTAQEVFLSLLTLKRRPEEDHIRPWLIAVTVNRCRNTLKSFWHRKVLPLDEFDFPAAAEDDRALAGEVLALPLKYRQAVYLYYYEGYSTGEIASMLRQNEATVRTRLRRGREKLKTRLTGDGDPQ